MLVYSFVHWACPSSFPCPWLLGITLLRVLMHRFLRGLACLTVYLGVELLGREVGRDHV